MKNKFIILLISFIIFSLSNCTRTPNRLYLLVKHGININKNNDYPLYSEKCINEINRLTGTTLRKNNSVKLLRTSNVVLKEMYQLIKQAKKSIYIEQYIFNKDETGKKFINLLSKKVKEGVDIKIVIDRIGCRQEISWLCRQFRKSKIKYRIFNPFLSWTIARINIRNHRKVLITDNKYAVITGIGLGNEFKYWVDVGVITEGPIVYDLTNSFNNIWNESGRGLIGKSFHLPLIDWIKSKIDNGLMKKIKLNIDDFKDTGTSKVRLAEFKPFLRYHGSFESLIQILNKAEKYIYITNAYFVPNFHFRHALYNAVKRGVDVKIITPKKTDLPFIKSTSRFYYSALLKKGVQIYERKQKTLHSKYIVIDDIWSSIGSTNINDRSFFMNYECNLNIIDNNFAINMKKVFINDINNSEQIKYETWKKRKFLEKLKELLHFTTIAIY